MGSIACVNGAFAQCVGEKWTLTPCSTGLSCFALPLVNSNGTSIACDTEQDAVSRISTSGASGGLTGAGNGAGSASDTTPASTNGVNSPTSIVSSSTSTPTSNPNDSGGDGDDCNDDPSESSSNANSTTTDSGGGDDDCNDDPPESSSNVNSTTTDSSDEGGDDCAGDDPMGESGPGANSPNSTDTTDASGTPSSASASASTMSASQVPPNGSSQLYRRQFTTDTGAATFAVPTQTAQTPSSDQTGTALSNLPSFTPTASNPAASTVYLVSTVTMTISECQGGNPTNFPTLASGTPGLSPAPPNTVTTPTAPFTFSTPAPFTPTASIPPSNTFATPTSSPSGGASLGDGGISFSSQGGNNVDLEPTPTTMPQYATNGPSSSFNLSELLTATAY